jgi:hypothetical protein
MTALFQREEQRTKLGKRVIIADFRTKIQIDFTNQREIRLFLL